MSSIGFNPDNFVKGSRDYKDHAIELTPVADTVEKPKRKSKKDSKDSGGSISIAAPMINDTNLNFLQSDVSYMTAYKETNDQLDSAIKELNILGGEMMNELMTIKSSKTLKNKYNYINDMTSTVSNIINTKISAIKEKNKVINDANNMDLRRMKELKMNQSQEDDTTKIANLYDAFINTPIGNYGPNVLGPSITDMTLAGGAPDMSRMAIGNDQVAWEQSLDPAQNRMLLEAKGAIDTVVYYDQASGNRWFEVIDRNTRQPVPNVEKPDDSYIWELDINVNGGFAKDSNRNTTYPLIIVNGQNNMSEY